MTLGELPSAEEDPPFSGAVADQTPAGGAEQTVRHMHEANMDDVGI